jgi:hypothetical protein
LARAFRFLFRILDKVSLRSFASVLVHVCVAVALAALFYFGQFVAETVSDNILVTIMAAVAAASGALLAVSLAFGTFRSQYYTDWTDRNCERLRNHIEKLEDRMRKSAEQYPDISRRLVGQYMFMTSYIRGQPVKIDEVTELYRVFHEWLNEQLVNSVKKVDFGNIDDYETFEKHAIDAHLITNESRDILTELSVAEMHGRALKTLPPLITTWALILVFSLVLAVIGSLNIISDGMNLSILIIPIYLCFFAGSGLVIDFWALMKHMRIREEGWEIAMSDFMQQRGLDKYK